MSGEYGYKLKNMVNNLKGNTAVCKQIESLKHTISNTDYCTNAINFYNRNAKWLVNMAEENISTVADLNNYVNWISNE
ncbi:MAG: hypothetical protein IJE91_00350 [Clostridia bacterium]|nr:hypothetical protein [Clostridia bacterium]